jgi:PadR family transcriptional regulator, regulatory protein AphA
MSRPELTTTSYAILGFLAIRPWTTYELAQQMQRTLNHMWPRARSKLYEEPKKLVAHGLATASKDTVGRRARTVYAITPAGRRALAAWLRTPSDDGMALESEHLVKLFFADHGRTQDALATLQATKAWALQQLDVFAEAARVYLAGEGAFRERAAVNMVGARFMVDFYAMVADWTDWANEVMASWPDHPKNAEPDWELMEEIYRRARPGSTRVGQTGAGGHPRRRSIR